MSCTEYATSMLLCDVLPLRREVDLFVYMRTGLKWD
jgi:hypothetical protein